MSRAHRILSLMVEYYGGDYYGSGGGGGYSSSPHSSHSSSHMGMGSAPHHSDSWGSNYDDPFHTPKKSHTLAKVLGGGALALGGAYAAHHFGLIGGGGGSGLAQHLPSVPKLPLGHGLPALPGPPIRRGAIELLKPPRGLVGSVLKD